jgi:hypothetical protein
MQVKKKGRIRRKQNPKENKSNKKKTFMKTYNTKEFKRKDPTGTALEGEYGAGHLDVGENFLSYPRPREFR